MTDLYSEWRGFYTKHVNSWMSLEELRSECGMLQKVNPPNPEVLLIHAMHALEECVQRDEALLRQALEALRAEVERLRSMTAMTMGVWRGDGNLFVHGDGDSIKAAQALVLRAERMGKALKDIRSLSSISSAMNPNSFALTVLLADIHHIADTALSKENRND